MRLAIVRLLCCCLLISLFTAGLVATLPAREWGLAGSRLKIEAEVVSYDGKKVKLKLPTGTIFPVDVEKMTPEDQTFLKQTYPDGKVDETAPAKDKAKNDKARAKTGSNKTTKKAPAKKAPDKKKDLEVADATPDEPAPPAEEMPAEDPAETPASSSGGVNVEVIGLSINKPQKATAGPGGMAMSFGPFASGTHIRLVLSDPERQIVGVDDASKVTACTDDQGTDLLKATGKPGPLFNKMMLQPGADGKSGTIDLDQPQVPAKEATKITLEGELLVVCGVGEKSEDVAEQALTKGTRFKIAGNAVRFGDIRKQAIGDMKLMVTLESPKPFSDIKKILLINAAGEEVEAQSLGSGSMAVGKVTIYQRIIGLNEVVQKAKFKVVSFESTETVKVPLALEVGLGL